MTRLKRKSEGVLAPRDDAEADGFLARIGQIQRTCQKAQAEFDEQVAAAKQVMEASLAPQIAEADRLTRGLQLWAEANRDRLTDGGKRKTVAMPAGEIGWRQRPPSVRLSGGVAAIVATLTELGLTRFLRVKTEVDKEAMLREPDAVAQVPGVKIGSEGEDFVVTPVSLELSGSAAA